MARMWGFSRHGRRWLGAALPGVCLALIATAAPASAELSSVDAYGGQAQVLGKPVHRHRATSNGAAGDRSSSGVPRQHGAGTTNSRAGGGSAQSSSGSSSSAGSNAAAGSGAPVTSGSGTSTPSSGTAGAGGQNAAGGARAGHHARGHSAAGAGAAVGAGAASGSAGGQSPPIAAANLADVSDGSLSLSALDVLLLVAVFLGLAGVGVLIRRWSRQPSSSGS